MTLSTLIEQYIAFRQSLGTQFRNNAATLRAFGRAIGPRVKMTAVRTAQVSKFLNGTGPVTGRCRLPRHYLVRSWSGWTAKPSAAVSASVWIGRRSPKGEARSATKGGNAR